MMGAGFLEVSCRFLAGFLQVFLVRTSQTRFSGSLALSRLFSGPWYSERHAIGFACCAS